MEITSPAMEITSSISTRAVLTFLLLLSATEAVLPKGECYVNDMTCEIDVNFIGIADNIMSAEDCKQECENNSKSTGCKVYSYYGTAGAPFRDTCLLLSGCSELSPVEDCVTEELECATSASFCHAQVEGILGENVIDIKPDVSEAACEAECEGEEQCHFFTYYFSNATVYPNTCFLLSEIQEPIIPCQDDICISGSSKCENSMCGILEDGYFVPNGIAVTESKEVDLLTIGPCSADGNFLAVVVGGGGSSSNQGAGSGSGHVEFQELQFSQSYVQFKATVGSAEQHSTLSTISDGSSDVLVQASPGERGEYNDGGDGYSGGGAYDHQGEIGADGGSDGGDGEDSNGHSGGNGSGLDLQTIPLTHFELSPGMGGGAGVSGSGGYGGGGGGVLIDGVGPSVGRSYSSGEGYGAGSYGYNTDGYPGVIVLEFK